MKTMAQMISGQDIARLHLDLEVPQLLSSILEKHDILSTHDEQLLRTALARTNGLECLISLACSFHVFTPYMNDEDTIISPLQLQADYVLDDYAPYWMKQSFPADEEWVHYVQEDLENVADFLSILSDAAHGVHPAISDICEILNEYAFLKSLRIETPAPAIVPETATDIAPLCTGNVIRFPVERRA